MIHLSNYFYVFKYFTSWVALLVIFSTYTGNVFNLLLLTLLTCIGGLYISFVYPKYYKFRFGLLEIKVNTLLERYALEFFVHFALLLYVYIKYRDNYTIFSYQTLNSIMLFVAYLLITDVKIMYNLRNIDIFRIAFVYFMMVIMLKSRLLLS